MSVTYIKLQVKPVWKLKKILFNIECYGEFFSGITPKSPSWIEQRVARQNFKMRPPKNHHGHVISTFGPLFQKKSIIFFKINTICIFFKNWIVSQSEISFHIITAESNFGELVKISVFLKRLLLNRYLCCFQPHPLNYFSTNLHIL